MEQRSGIIAHDVKAAVFHWAFRSGGAHDDMAAGLDGAQDLPDLGGALLR